MSLVVVSLGYSVPGSDGTPAPSVSSEPVSASPSTAGPELSASASSSPSASVASVGTESPNAPAAWEQVHTDAVMVGIMLVVLALGILTGTSMGSR